MADTGLFLIIAGMTVLLVMSVSAVIALSPQDAVRTEPPVLNRPVPPPSPAGRPEATAPPAAAAGQPGDTADSAWQGDRVVTPNQTYPPEVGSGPPWGPAPKPSGLAF